MGGVVEQRDLVAAATDQPGDRVVGGGDNLASCASAAASYPPISASRRNWAVIASSVGCASSPAPALFR